MASDKPLVIYARHDEWRMKNHLLFLHDMDSE